MQIVKGFVCMNCTDVERAQKGIDPAHPDQPARVAGPRDGASETSGTAGPLTQDAVSFGGALSHLNALDNKSPSDRLPGEAGASLDILA
ncbi:MAG: hypothetical protein DI543_14925 [Bradyrhizobium icense]|jgi:hypothetical protein|nr:MAG: hypothetical protein DI543_14925 [Bradyrhizobium icense]